MSIYAPQNVVPRAKHWKPEAAAKRPGVEERITPATLPIARPDAPENFVSRLFS